MSKKTGYLFKNKFKTKETPNAPDYAGELEIGGSRYRIAGWIAKTKSDGVPFISLAARLKTRQTIQSKIDAIKTNPET